MPATIKYCPQTSQISAALIRVDTCDTRRFMNPLMGIWDQPATVPGYWHASPNGDWRGAGDHLPYRALAPNGAGGYPTILNSEFLILNWTYTFSAKERDSETGLSYFGSRYYSSELSIWLSVDPMSDKYASLSPYVYCADNPVRCVDPNGEEVIDDKPPGKLAELLRSWDRAVSGSAANRQLEGGGDGANAGTMTKQDVEVAVTVGATMLSGGAALGAETAFDATVAIVSAVNSIDDATVNSAGQTASQRASSNNPTANSTVNATKQVVSVVATGHSGYTAFSSVRTVVQKGGKDIQKAATKMLSATANFVGTIRSFFKKK